MPKPSPPISLADLSAAGIRLRPYEVVTIVRELILLVARGDVAGVPSAHVIRLSGSGALSVEGPVGAGGPSVARAAQLLESLLPTTTDADPQFRIPGALKLVVARGLGAIDLPPFMSLDSLRRCAEPVRLERPGRDAGQTRDGMGGPRPDTAKSPSLLRSPRQSLRRHLRRSSHSSRHADWMRHPT